MSTPLFQVDAFTGRPFTGNPAAVCLLEAPRDAAWMQDVASEMNLAETAFLVPRNDGWNLRWFTPTIEVDLCGHATLGSAHVLFETRALKDGERARFHTRSGLLTCEKRGEWIEMDFPSEPAHEVALPDDLVRALDVQPRWIGKNRFDWLVEVATEEEVRGLAPDFRILAKISTRGVIVTSRSRAEYDFISRFFAPAAGIDEDPVTGSAHCCLGPYWSERLNKRELVGWQASKRGGLVRVQVNGERTILAGQCITILRGELA